MDSPREDSSDKVGADPVKVSSATNETEKMFENCLEDMRNEPTLKMYSDTYTKLFDTYFEVKAESDSFKKTIEGLKEEIDRFKSVADKYDEMQRDFETTIQNQKNEIESARRLADAMHARELATAENIDGLRKALTKLEMEDEARKKLGDMENAIPQSKNLETLEAEISRLNIDLEAMKQRLQQATEHHLELERLGSEADLVKQRLEEKLEDKEMELMRVNRNTEQLKVELQHMTQQVENRGVEIGDLMEKLEVSENISNRRATALKLARTAAEEAQKHRDTAENNARQIRKKLDDNRKADEERAARFNAMEKEMKIRNDEISRLRNEISKVEKQNADRLKKYSLLETAKAKSDSERDRGRQTLAAMEREILSYKKLVEAEKREAEDARRDRDLMLKQVRKIEGEAEENLQMISMQEQRRQKLESELENSETMIRKQRMQLKNLDSDKDRLLGEAIALNDKIDDMAEEVRLRTSDALDASTQARLAEARFKRQRAALEALRAERNSLHAALSEAQDKNADDVQKMKMIAYQIEQLKEDITAKESGLKSTENQLNKAHRNIESIKVEVQDGVSQLCNSRMEVQALKQEELRLTRVIQESDMLHARQTKEIEVLQSDKDILGQRLQQKNDDITALNEKISLLDTTLARGEKQYEQRIEDIRLLRLEIVRLRCEKNLMLKAVENFNELKLEVFNLEREVSRWRLRARALEEALATPANVHRWRRLAGADPPHMDLLEKLRLLQKKVLSQSETMVLQEQKLRETENLYAGVKDMLALQPTPEVQEQLNKTQKALTQRSTKLKCLVAELSMRESQVSDSQEDMERLTAELNDYKAKYFKLKKSIEEEDRKKSKYSSGKITLPSCKETGGGFKLAPII